MRWPLTGPENLIWTRSCPIMDLDDLTKILSGAIGWGVPLSRGGYSGKDYEYIMTGQRAFLGIIAELDRQIDEADAKVHSHKAPPRK